MRITFYLFLALTTISTASLAQEKTRVNTSEIVIYNFNQLNKLLQKKSEKTYVINFWATWCAPCVKELPYFEEITKTYSTNKIEVILVSLDFPNKFEDRLIPFVKKHQLQSKVILLDAPNENEWIPKVDSSWSGAIPATYF